MSELPDGVLPATVPDPRQSASAVLLRRAGAGGWEVLLGLRSRDSRFMPGHLAFPGGAVEAADRPADLGFHSRCVAREVEEEVGIEIAAGEWKAAGERVTPPLFPLRFRTRFFVALLPASAPAALRPASAENEQLLLARPAQVLEDWERGRAKVPPPLLPILRAVGCVSSQLLDDVVRAVEQANDGEERAPRIEFVPGVWMLPLRTMTLPPATHTNVWIPGGRRFVLVDPGSDDAEEIERLLRVVERRTRSGGTAAAVLLTHHHADHMQGAARVARALGVPIRAHDSVLRELDARAPGSALEPLGEGDVLDLGGEMLRVHHTPGHAPGHLAFHLPQRRALIAGDMVSGLSTILIDPVHGDMGAYLASLERLRALDCTVILPGHGPPLAPGELARVIEHRRSREARILALLERETSPELAQIAAGAYPDATEMPEALTRGQTLSHLRWLERSGLACRVDPAGRRWRRPGPGASRIREILEARFRPLHLELRDESDRHVGHAGASSGGGHYHVVLVAAEFTGQSRLDQHRLVNAALADLFGKEIHALGLATYSPAEWERAR